MMHMFFPMKWEQLSLQTHCYQQHQEVLAKRRAKCLVKKFSLSELAAPVKMSLFLPLIFADFRLGEVIVNLEVL